MWLNHVLRLILCAALYLTLPNPVCGHGYLMSPRSRNYVAAPSQDGRWSGGTASSPLVDPNPHSLNRGGLCGISPLEGGTSYTLPQNALGGAMPLNVQATYEQGATIDVEVVLTAHHRGHFEFKACPLAQHGDVPTQDCFDDYELEFVEDLIYGAPKDDAHPCRAYIPPATDSTETAGNPSGKRYRYRYKLPSDLNGAIVLLQWHYVTGNSCVDVGYNEYDFPWSTPNLSTCSQPLDQCGNGIPEQFWNCAEISIAKAQGSPDTIPPPAGPASLPCFAPTAPTFYAPVPSPILVPTAPVALQPDWRCGYSWADANSKCGVACPTGNSTVCPSGELCYADVVGEACSSPETSPPTITPTSSPSSVPTVLFQPTAAPVDHDSTAPVLPTSAPANPPPPPPPPFEELVASTTPRCGSTELEAREMCNPTCVSGADCAQGQWCWGTHPTYCSTPGFTPKQWINPSVSSITHRCGKSEVDARSFCKTPCMWPSDCTEPGENCYAVHQNYCGSESSPSRMLRRN
mmetsp:Transcript_3313/g.7203  ORF Transcript_3313/g.7203 Transcript_3313/m.7203 type:complete len:518 (+) Transcript_3313:241-1794(+)